MSISSALSNALSGLGASARAANVVSSNLANVLTEGFASREIALASRTLGSGGVQVLGVTRQVDQALLADRRLADGQLAHADTLSQFLGRLETIIGIPGTTGSISTRIADFEASLITTASKPEATDRLQAAVNRAGDLANALAEASSQVQASRTRAEGEIASAVETINTTLEQIRALNAQITSIGGDSGSTASLEDHRQAAIDRLSALIPVRQIPRDGNTIALYTPGGAILLDGTPAALEFSPSNVVAPHMTLANGLLSGLQINGIDVNLASEPNAVSGGKLAALFDIRDQQAPDAQTQLDALARDLVERFEQPGLDPTLAAGAPGLFTDAGAAFDPLNEVGLSGRLAINAAVDPGQGGAFWRLRDGLGAAVLGPPGNAGFLQALQAVLSENSNLNSGDLGGTARSAAGHIASFVSRIGQARVTIDQNLSFATAIQTELTARERESGVDSDAELQNLLLIEQAYAANARMIATVDEMMQTLLRI